MNQPRLPYLLGLLLVILLALVLVNSSNVTFAQDDNPGIVPTNTPGNPTTGNTPTNTRGALNELLISYDPAATPAQVAGMLARIGGVEVERIPGIHVMRVKVPPMFSSPANARAAIASNNASVLALGKRQIVEQNVIYSVTFDPNDALENDQEHLQAIKAHTVSPAIGGWDLNPTRGTGVTIAIVDSGVVATHPDLALNMVPGYDFVDDDTNPMDTNGHGTHVAGIAAARGNNSIGVAGVAFNAKIMPVRVMGTDGTGYTMDIAQGIVYAADKGAKVINLSLSGPDYSATQDAAIQYAISKGAVVIAAAGNGGTDFIGDDLNLIPRYPASLPSVITVGSVTSDPTPTRSSFSNYGQIEVVAPGELILSTCLVGDVGLDGTCLGTSPYYRNSGTSMATPIVSGVAALILSQKVATTPEQVKEALMCGALDLGTPGNDTIYGAGLVQTNYSLNWHDDNSSLCHVTLANDDVRRPLVVGAMPYKSTQAITGRNASMADNDPDISCNVTPQQSVWYKFVPTTSGHFQISTMGSSYDTAVAIYKGDPGSLVEVGCNDDYDTGFTQSVLVADLHMGQPYHVMVSTAGGSAVVDEVLELTANPVIIATTRIENSAINIAYTGTWATVAMTGQSGTVSRTTDNSALAVFTIRSWGLIIAQTTGPDKGNMDIYVNGGIIGSLYNRTPTTRFQQQTMGPSDIFNFGTLATRTFVIKRGAAGPAGPIDLDWIQGINSPLGAMTAITGTVDERDARIKYNAGVWSDTNGVPLTHMGTLRTTTADSDYAQFKFTGTAFTIYRRIGVGLGTASIWVDGILYGGAGYMNNGHTTTINSVPFAVNGLSSSEHIVTISPDVGGTLSLDKVIVASPADVPSSTTTVILTDERFAGALYSGVWADASAVAGANAGTIKTTTDGNASVKFTFIGNQLAIGYGASTSGGMMRIYVDGILKREQDTDLVSGPTVYNQSIGVGVLTSAKHVVEVVPVLDPGESLILDDFWAYKFPTIMPSQNLVAETSTAYLYLDPLFYPGGSWSTKTSVKFNGGAAKQSTVHNEKIFFTINGTGAVIYTENGDLSGTWHIYVDGSLYTSINMERNGQTQRPAIIGVADLGPGPHNIWLYTSIDAGETLIFDGVRVFP